MAAAGLWSRTLGVDLTRESANLHGSRRQSVPWQEVQAVVRYGRGGSTGVRLILEHGKPVTLRAPTTMWGLGAAQFDRDFHCIDQWWLAHRGESWRPARVETPPPPVQGGGSRVRRCFWQSLIFLRTSASDDEVSAVTRSL